MKPRVVIVRAVSFRCRGMVIRGVVIGYKLFSYEMTNVQYGDYS